MSTISPARPRMSVTSARRTAGEGGSWKTLYRIGAVSAWLFVAFNLAATVVYIVAPQAPVADGALTLSYIAGHRTLYILSQQLWLVPGLFAAVVYLALYPALRDASRSLAALGAAVGGGAWALTLAMPTTSTGAPALVYLSDQWAAATDAGQQSLFVAAAEGLIAINRTPTAVGVLTTIGMIIVSVVMLRGGFRGFPRWVALLGIATGVVGIASEALRPVIEGGYALYGMLLFVWMGAVGWGLRGLDETERSPATAGSV